MKKNSKKINDKAYECYVEMLKRVKDELKRRTAGGGSKIKKYIEAYEREIKEIKKESSYNELLKECLKSNIVLFGNFATEDWPKVEFYNLLQSIYKSEKSIAIAIDWVPYKQRKLLKDYVDGKIRKREFVKKLEQGSLSYIPFPEGYFRIIDFAKTKKIPIIPLDFEEISEDNIEKKDDATALRIGNFFKASASNKIIALLPDTWLAQSHIPKKLKKQVALKKQKAVIARVFSSSDKIYLKLAKQGKSEKASIVMSSDKTFVYNMIHPIARYNTFFNYIDGEDQFGDFQKRKEGFKAILEKINVSLKLGIDLKSLKYKLYSDFEMPFLKKILESGFLNDRQKAGILEYVSGGESYFIPYSQIIYLNNLGLIHAAEEAGHYLRYVMAGLEKPKTSEDRFYSSVLNEAMAFMASKTIVPYRKPVNDNVIMLAMQPDMPEEERENIMIHSMGYNLGNNLFKKFMRGKISARKVKEIFSNRFKQKGQARKYFDALTKLTETN